MSERRCYYCNEGEYTADAHCPGADPGWGHRFVEDEPVAVGMQTSCLVLHAPGSCCHMGETKVEDEPTPVPSTGRLIDG